MSDSTGDPFSAPSPFETIEDFFALADEIDPRTFKPVAKGETGMSKWELVFTPHARGGGPFGGRDNAATALTGFLRAKRIPLEAARSMAAWWDRTYCDPPLGDRVMEDKLNRAWVRWEAGGLPDLTPEEVRGEKAPLNFMTAKDLLELEESGGGCSFIVDGAIVERGLNMVTAPPGGAKSWLMLDLARRFAVGGAWFQEREVTQCGVLYLDEEMGAPTVSTRVKKLRVPPDAPFFYLGKSGVKISDPLDSKHVLEFCTANNVRVIFLDTLIRFHGLDENDNSQMAKLQEFFRPWLAAGLTVFMGHHDRKKGADSDVKHERSRGAGDIQGQMDMTYAIDKIGHMFRLTVTKPRHISEEDAEKLATDFVIEDVDGGERVIIREVDAAEKQAQRDADAEARVMTALVSGPMNTRSLERAAGGRKSDIAEAARRMAETGAIAREKSGREWIYSLPEMGLE